MTELYKTITSNPVLNISFIAWASAQVIKTMLYWAVTGRFRSERLLGSGGMPSSHTALVCAMTTAMFRVEGIQSTQFALSLILSSIVMYDALGVRRAAGEQAKALNRMSHGFKDMHKFFLSMVNASDQDISDAENGGRPAQYTWPVFDGEKLLKEFLGHTPVEVLAGAALGTAVGFVYAL
jgi:acid phosphatase family membrane protein YuiD